MVNKRSVSLFLDASLIDYFSQKAREELKDEGEPINRISVQRKRSRLMVDLLTEYYEAENEE